MAPLAFAGAGLASVTLSACYGVPCAAAATKVILPDASTTTRYTCWMKDGGTYDCRLPLADGGNQSQDPEWADLCTDFSYPPEDAGMDGGSDGGSDGG